jgi:antitoxin (DNA-binding transcriptional repressor) of toxin-antitoxin stability system
VIKVDLRETIMRFSKYMKLVRQGEEVVVMERGAPIAVIKPLVRVMGPEQRVRILEEQGLLKRSVRTTFPLGAPVILKGRAIAKTVTDDRKERF